MRFFGVLIVRQYIAMTEIEEKQSVFFPLLFLDLSSNSLKSYFILFPNMLAYYIRNEQILGTTGPLAVTYVLYFNPLENMMKNNLRHSLI